VQRKLIQPGVPGTPPHSLTEGDYQCANEKRPGIIFSGPGNSENKSEGIEFEPI
jgi:hypothetical protein